MATAIHMRIVEDVFGYTFADQSYLRLALTAAGAEEDNWDGNRRLAMVGEAALQLAVLDVGYQEGASRGKHCYSSPRISHNLRVIQTKCAVLHL